MWWGHKHQPSAGQWDLVLKTGQDSYNTTSYTDCLDCLVRINRVVEWSKDDGMCHAQTLQY